MNRHGSLFLFVAFTLALLAGCAAENKPNGPECITALDCEDGYTCEEEQCVALPDIPPADKDTAAADDMTDELLDDEEFPVDETAEEDSVEPGDDTTEVRDDAVETGDDMVETGDDMVEVGDDAVIVDEDTADIDTADEDMADEDMADEDTVDLQPDLDMDLYVETTSPTVVSTSPESDATGVGVGTLIEVTFSEPINEATLTTLTITVEDDSPATVNGAVTYTAGTYTAVFTPTASLTYDTVYTVTVTTGVEDEAGNGLAADHEFSFTTAIEEINECVTMDNPCDAQGDTAAICSDTLGGYDCACSGGFTPSGGTCQDVDECTLNTDGCAQDCQNTTGSHTCSCISGYTLNGDGHTCDNINECVTLDNPCNDHNDSGGSCADTDGGYTCTCSGGYNFTGGGCKDIDECLAGGDPCDDYGDDDALCSNLQGSYSCTCVTPGYAFSSGSCRDIDECTVNNNPCNDNGDTLATCTNTAGDYTCNCSGGWFDNGTTCDDSDECVGNPCDNGGDAGATCQDQVGDYTCNCSSGWDFSGGTTCTETNECITLSNPCNDNGDTTATCTNTTGSYTCGCNFGFEFTLGGCRDIDECSLGTDTCHVNADCTNTPAGSYTCTCKLHYSGNGYTCTADTQTFTCAAKPVTGTDWNTVSSYLQTWNGTAWNPADSTTSYNATGSATECRYKCATNYTWNGSICAADTKTYTCNAKPAIGTDWNTVSSYAQTWSGSAWSPADDATTDYNATGSATECRYKCAANYTWNGSTCTADTRLFTCAAKPANSAWNTVSDYEQTWNGSSWLPADSTPVYSTTPSTTACRFTCLANYTWNGSACIADTRTFTCAAKPASSDWNTVSSYSQTWNGSAWLPADSTTAHNTTPSSTECRFKCQTNYTWNGSICAADTKTFNCTAKPTNSQWNTVAGYEQTWNGSAWIPVDSTTTYNETGSSTSCRFTCVASYHWDGSNCISDSRTFTCAAKPANTSWNTVSEYSQTWNGSAWSPADSTTSYNTTPSSTACRFQCLTNYTWNGSNACVADTRTYNCAAKPQSGETVYNTVSSYLQTWNGSAWTPADDATTEYNATGSATACRYTCNTNYNWDGDSCEAATRTYTCNAKPATGTDWNTVSQYTQTWNGSAWSPADDATTEYNATASTTACRYICAAAYHWDGSNCVSNTRTFNCAAKPANSEWNIVASYTQTWSGSWSPADSTTVYDTSPTSTACHFQCLTNYTWNGTACAADTRTYNCAAKPQSGETVYNTVSSYLQTWNGSAWSPADDATTEYNATGSATACRYTCNTNYTWNGSSCVAATRTFTCAAKPAIGTVWNTVSSYGQTWNGSAWSPVDSATAYNTTPDTNSCRYTCATNYTWNGSICAANTQSGTCTGLPANAEWNTVSSITQTWNGSAWTPTTVGAYNATPSTTECRFKCSGTASWNGSACVPNVCGDGVLGGTIPAFVEGFEGGKPSYSDGDWSTSTSQKHAGSYSLKSYGISDSSESGTYNYTTIRFLKYTDGQVCFWYAGQSESGWDYFRVYEGARDAGSGGTEKFETSGDHSTWAEQCISVTAGYTTISFEYSRDYSGGLGWNTWYIDDIRFYNATTEQCETGQTSNCTNLGYECSDTTACGTDCTWKAGEAECHDDGGCGC